MPISPCEVLEFIKRRFPTDCNWCNGNCYYFAVILCKRFSWLEPYYLPIEGHFMAGNGTFFFDHRGVHYKSELEETPYEWSKYEEFDCLDYNRIVRDCIN